VEEKKKELSKGSKPVKWGRALKWGQGLLFF
jgi:hypothetical protein